MFTIEDTAPDKIYDLLLHDALPTSADITARDLTVTAAGINKVYDGTTAATVRLSENLEAPDNVKLT